MNSLNNQRGATLLVTMIFLVLITLLASSMLQFSDVHYQVIRNMQNQNEAEKAAQQGIEEQITSIAYFEAGTAAATRTINNMTVDVAAPACIDTQPADGYSALDPFSPEDNVWDIPSTGTSIAGSSVEIHQGVKIRQPAGRCP